MPLFDELSTMLGGGSTLSTLGTLTGGDAVSTKKGLEGGVPLLLGALGKKAALPGGAAALFNLIKGDSGGVLDDVGGFLGQGDTNGIGGQLIGGLLGKRRNAVELGLAKHAGLPAGGIAKLLPMLAPLVLGFLAKKRTNGGLDQAGVARLLSDERGSMDKAGMGGLLGLLDGDDDDDQKGFLDGFGKIAGLGGLAAVVPGLGKLTSSLGTVTDRVTGVASGATSAAMAAAGALGATAAGGAGALGAAAKGGAGALGAAAKGGVATAGRVVVGSVPSVDVKKKKRSLWWWLLPVAAIAALGIGLTQCGGDDAEAPVDTGAVTAAPVESVAESTEAVVEETAETAATETISADSVATETTPTETVAATGDIVATALGNPDLSTLASAVEAAGLTSTLQGKGPFTVLAPTNAAFDALPTGVLDALLLPENKDTLAKVLTYHVIPGTVAAADVASGPAPSVEGSELTLANDGGAITVNGANVLTADVAAANGVVHVIDQVLVPASVDIDALLAGSVAATAVAETTPAETETAAAETAPAETAAAATTTDYVVYFDTSSSALDAKDRATIAEAVVALKVAGSGPVNLVGHADVRGNAAANRALSEARVKSVEAALRAAVGFDAGKFTFTSDAEGDTKPEADLAKSRRVTIQIG